MTSSQELSVTHLGAKEGRSRPRQKSHFDRQKARQRPTVCIIYDDGRDGEYDFWQKHAEYGIPASSAVQAADLGGVLEDGDGMLTVDELQEMTTPGNGADWEVIAHGYTAMHLKKTNLDGNVAAGDTTIPISDPEASGTVNGDFYDPDYTYIINDGTNREIVSVASVDRSAGTWTLASGLANSYDGGTDVWPTDDTLTYEIGGCKDLLNELGFTVSGWAYSGHNTLGPIGRAVVSRHFKWARSQQLGDADVTAAPETTPVERYTLDSVKYNTLTSTERANFLDEVEANSKLGILFAHADSASLSDADTILSALKDRDIDVVTPSEAIARFEGNTPQQPQARKVPETGLQAWYPMVNGGDPILDVSGYANDATWNNPANYTTGMWGRAAKFPAGTDGNVTIPNDSSIVPSTGDYSVVMHVRTFDIDNSGRTYFWFFGDTGGRIDCYYANGKIVANVDDGSNTESLSEQFVPDGAGGTLQIALVRDTAAGEVGLYLNASQDANNTPTGDSTGDISPSEGFGFGNDGGYELYDLQIHKRAVGRHELQTMLDAQMPMGVHEGSFRAFDSGFTDPVELDPANDGVIVRDQSDGNRYRVVVDGGALTTQGPL